MSNDNTTIPYGKHSVDADDIESVVDILQNKFLTQGLTVPQFERALCEYTSAKFATAVNSATSGLHAACLALGVTKGDLVWTVPNSFVASANCALYCGAQIDFVDIDPETRNLSLFALEQKLAQAAKNNKLPKVLVVVHFSGSSCDMQRIKNLTQEYNVRIIEDAAHALGGEYLGHKIGCCQFSDISVLSFHPVKSITTAEGGAVLTNDPTIHQRIVLFAKHGITRDKNLIIGDSHGPWYYQQIELGYNYRLSDLHAALGISQLKKLDQFILQRRQIAQRYSKELKHLPLKLPVDAESSNSAWHLYMVECTEHVRKNVFDELQVRGIGVNVHYIPIHIQPYYQKLGFNQGDFPNAEDFYNNALTIPLYPNLTTDEQSKVIAALNEVLS